MGDKDPSPFGYTFSSGYLDSEPPVFDTNQSLLTDIESQSIADFFTNTDPFHLADPHAFAPTADIKDGVDDFSNWANFITPATVHGVSTTIPDQAHLQNTLFNDHAYPQPPLPLDHLGNTHDDLQAASTLFQNSQSSYADNRPLDYNTLPSSSKNANINSAPTVDLTGKPLVLTHNGLIIEQLAALLPNHAEEGTLDAQFAAHWANNSVLQSQYHHLHHRPSLKRSYTFGTDESFSNPAGYSAPHTEADTSHVVQHFIRESRRSQPTLQNTGIDGTPVSPNGRTRHNDLSEEDPSEEATSDEDEDDRPVKKRRKSKHGKNGQKASRNGKNRKSSAAEESGKKKRLAAAQKLQRENLTEEQKRSNHILSEQKRRNLIKRGFDELHDLVPEIRNGGLSKSSVLTEAANFLEKLIEENNNFRRLTGG